MYYTNRIVELAIECQRLECSIAKCSKVGGVLISIGLSHDYLTHTLNPNSILADLRTEYRLKKTELCSLLKEFESQKSP